MAVDPIIKQKADDIRHKIYGKEVRESLASGIEAISEDVEATIGRQDYVEEQFQNVIDETTDKDVISAPELIAARNGKSNLKTRLDDEHAQVSAQLAQKARQIDLNQTNISVSGVNQRVDNLTIPLSPENANLEVTDSHVSVTKGKTFNSLKDRFEETEYETIENKKDIEHLTETGRNLFNPAKITHGFTISSGDGSLTENINQSASDFIKVESGMDYFTNQTINKAEYDANKNFISYQGITFNNKFTTTNQTKYVRFGLLNTRVDELMFNKGSFGLDFVTHYDYLRENTLISEKNYTQKTKELLDVANQSLVKQTNLVDESKELINYSLSNGKLVTNTDYIVCDYVVVDGKEVLSNRTIILAEYDKDKRFIKQTVQTAGNIFNLDQQTVYVRFGYTKASKDLWVNITDKRSISFMTDSFKPYMGNYNHLRGKEGIAFGDSNTMLENYPEAISKYYDCNYINFGLGATRLSKIDVANYPYSKIGMCQIAECISSGDWSEFQANIQLVDDARGDTVYSEIFNRILGIDFSKINFITLNFGTNDANNENFTLGVPDSTDPYTWHGAINYAVDLIQTAYPNIQIYLISPIFRGIMRDLDGNSDEVTKAVYMYDMADAMGERAKKHHLPFKDLYNESGINRYTWPYYLNADGTHLNDRGKKLVFEKISKFLNKD